MDMGKKKTLFYKFGGLVTQTLVSEDEMAKELGITVSQLHQAISKHGLPFHAHPLATGEGYLFLPKQVKANKERMDCIRGNGHVWEFDHYYDHRLQKAVYKCKNCPADKYD